MCQRHSFVLLEILKKKSTDMTKQDISILAKEDVLSLISKEWMLVTAGDKEKFNTMTASWGGIGFIWNKPVAFIFIRSERFTHEFIENNERLTLSFYGEDYRKALQICGSKSGRATDKVEATGLTPTELESGSMTFGEARMTLDCKKLFKSTMQEESFMDNEFFKKFYNEKPGGSLHDLYIIEIENIYTK